MVLSLTPDQYKFLMANVAGLALAIPFNFVPKSLRNEYNYLPGLLMIYYCFGDRANSLILYSAISYAISKYAPRHQIHRLHMCCSLSFLSYIHLSRQLLDYGGYVLDISGPFMIAVQKMTSLGFSMYDGYRLKEQEKEKLTVLTNINKHAAEQKHPKSPLNDANNNIDGDETNESVGSDESVLPALGRTGKSAQSDILSLTDEQIKYAVHTPPSFNEFMGYFFHFPSVLCGPIMYFTDYQDFINRPSDKPLPSGRFEATMKKITISTVCALLHLYALPNFSAEVFETPTFAMETMLYKRFYYVLIFTMLSRLKYYVAWHLGEALSNASGFGFNGYDAQGKPQWNLISNMDIFKFETCLNLREAILAWNKTTQNWLRRTAYERVPKRFSVLSTYLLSAVWHGFYPGYYLTFLSGALFTYAARNGRRYIRPMFLRGKVLPKIYNAVTFILTRLTIAYAACPFVILDFDYSFRIYQKLYFSIHILALGGVFLGLVGRK